MVEFKYVFRDANCSTNDDINSKLATIKTNSRSDSNPGTETLIIMYALWHRSILALQQVT